MLNLTVVITYQTVVKVDMLDMMCVLFICFTGAQSIPGIMGKSCTNTKQWIYRASQTDQSTGNVTERFDKTIKKGRNLDSFPVRDSSQFVIWQCFKMYH